MNEILGAYYFMINQIVLLLFAIIIHKQVKWKEWDNYSNVKDGFIQIFCKNLKSLWFSIQKGTLVRL